MSQAERPRVVVVGDLVADVAVGITEPVRPAADTRCVIEVRRGGSAANVAAGLVARGVSARLVGPRGADPLSLALAAELEGAGVELFGTGRGRGGVIVVMVDPSGERTMLTDRGRAEEWEGPEPGWCEGVDAVHLSAYGLLGAAGERVVAALAERGPAWLSIDVASTQVIAERGVEELRSLVSVLGPRLVFANADEAKALELDRPLAGVEAIIVKDGAGAASWREAGAEPVAVPVEAPLVGVDTTGAGDAFAAGVLAAVLAGSRGAPAVAAGHRAAGELLRGRSG